MAHQNSNRIIIEKGTEVNTGNATFLVKSGSSNETLEASVDDAVITNGGVLIQVMDNDDATNGGMMDPDDELNANGGSENFKPYHTEEAGFNTSEAKAGAFFVFMSQVVPLMFVHFIASKSVDISSVLSD